MRYKKRGFTLVEIMIVVAIIALLAAIAIPNLLRARHNANEAAAISALRTICSAQVSYRAVSGSYADSLGTLNTQTPPYIDSVLGGGSKNGYAYQITSADEYEFLAEAHPESYQNTGTRSFNVDEDGVLYGGDNGGDDYGSEHQGSVIE